MSKSPISSRQKAFHPMRITCVIDTNENFIDSVFNIVETHCDDMDIEYDIRFFESSKYSDDRKNISKLPAFHIYLFGLYETTFYAKDDVIEMIDIHFEKMNMKKQKVKARRDAWNKYFQLPKKVFHFVSSHPTESNPMPK
jgi:hypothetical protein